MKKVFILILSLFLISGCTANDGGSDTKLYATMYPFEYAAKFMYGEFSQVSSIYPSGADISTYELTKKQKNLYSKADIFIYSGASNEVNLAVDFLNANSELKIIDATKGLKFNNSIEELWLDPSNYLMIAKNIESTLVDQETNVYNQEKIEDNYNDLKIKISEIDVDLTLMGKNASRKNILVTDETFSFLSKYGVNVISIDPNNQNLTKNYNDAKKLISSGDIKYICVMKGKALSEEIEAFITNNKLEKLEIDPLYTLDDEDRKNNNDYLTIMNENITKLKTELFR